jgi:hypothetical protein
MACKTRAIVLRLRRPTHAKQMWSRITLSMVRGEPPICDKRRRSAMAAGHPADTVLCRHTPPCTLDLDKRGQLKSTPFFQSVCWNPPQRPRHARCHFSTPLLRVTRGLSDRQTQCQDERPGRTESGQVGRKGAASACRPTPETSVTVEQCLQCARPSAPRSSTSVVYN